ncbi:MAG: hypothetical protein ACOCUF_00255 [Patescibacteria group bacterium]
MPLNPYKKTKAFLVLNLTILFILIIAIPQFINSGTEWMSEDTLETLFLGMSFLAVLYVFWHYDYVVKKREQEASKLFLKLEKKEKELLDTFQYLGKVNVQFSIIRDLLQKMKAPAPTSREEVEKAFSELLNIVCNATGRRYAFLKIVDLKNGKTLIEQFNGFDSNMEKESLFSIKNETLLEVFNNKKQTFSKFKKGDIFFSDLDNFNLKAFLILPKKKEIEMEDESSFLEAVANQCEVLFLLFNSRYYKPKKKSNESKNNKKASK